MRYELLPAPETDIAELMTWFPDAAAVDIWSGPRFRFPFSAVTFAEDCRWNEFSSFRLEDESARLLAFGQISERHDRAHLARLIVRPSMRGAGVGRSLVTALVERARRLYDFEQCGLFAYRHNTAALRCYRSVGFEITRYPDDAPMRDRCYYLTRRF